MNARIHARLAWLVIVFVALGVSVGVLRIVIATPKVPTLRICSSKDPLAFSQEIERLSKTPFARQLMSLNALGANDKSGLDDFLVHVQEGLYRDYQWPLGTTIKMAFLSGDPRVIQRIIASAKTWSTVANIKFLFIDNPAEADVRIGVDLNGRSESLIGTQVLRIPKTQETMHFGWLTPSSTQAEYDNIVLHEFGHVLGSVHEHQLPSNGIHWNREFVYNYCTANWKWERKDVDQNIFNQYTPEHLLFSPMDPQSVMIYYFPKEWTTDGYSAPWNSALSAGDRTFMAKVYPFR